MPDILKLRIGLWGLLTACGATATAATVFGFLGGYWWFFDLFSHFRVQYFIGLALLAVILLFSRRYALAACFGAFAVANLATIAPLYVGRPSGSATNSPLRRAMLMNVKTQSGRPELVGQAITQHHPDVLVLEEVNEKWLSALSVPLQPYGYRKAEPREDNFGIAMFSRFPMVHSDIRMEGAAEVPMVVVELDTPDGPLTVIGIHAVPPAGQEGTRLRNDQLARLPEIVKQARSPVLLLGDLNTTPWSQCFRSLLQQSALQDSARGRGVQPTWPTFMPLLWIPIDHCLHTAGIQISRRRVGQKVGSDHYPLIVDFTRTPIASTR